MQSGCAANTIPPIRPWKNCKCTRRWSGGDRCWDEGALFFCFCLHSSLLLLTQTNLDNISESLQRPTIKTHTHSCLSRFCARARTNAHRKPRRVARSRAQNAQQAGPADGEREKRGERGGRMQGEARREETVSLLLFQLFSLCFLDLFYKRIFFLSLLLIIIKKTWQISHPSWCVSIHHHRSRMLEEAPVASMFFSIKTKRMYSMNIRHMQSDSCLARWRGKRRRRWRRGIDGLV